MEKFYEHIDKEHKEICELLNINKPMLPLTDEEKRTHKAAKHCKECDAQFTRKNHKVRHHSHLTGKYISTCCNNCNLQLKLRKAAKRHEDDDDVKVIDKDEFFLPVVAHNLRGYDGHIIVKNLNKKFIGEKKLK